MNPIEIGDWTFHYASYDAEADVLYLSIDEPSPGVGEETPEGHICRFDEAGNFAGVTLFGVKEAHDAGETLTVTLPQRAAIGPRDLELCLA